jgi:excisionase family DNA binding protein
MALEKGGQKVELITPDEAARLLRVSRRTISRLCEDQKIPAAKIGFQWRIDKVALLSWFTSHGSYGQWLR